MSDAYRTIQLGFRAGIVQASSWRRWGIAPSWDMWTGLEAAAFLLGFVWGVILEAATHVEPDS